jgi:hypothetical protein
MCSLMRKSAVLLSILTFLALSCVIAGPKKDVPFRLIDGGAFIFLNEASAKLVGRGLATHLGKIVSGGEFTNVGPNPECENGFLGKIVGEATAANGDTLEYEILGAKFCPDPNGGSAPTVFNGVGKYKITRGTGRFAQVTGSGDFIGLADFGEGTYSCLLNGTISYPKSEK